MELWVIISGEKKKFQGSFKSVMEDLYLQSEGKEVKLLSIHAPKKELRRFKRELVRNNKNLILTAKKIARWFYIKDLRKVSRCIKDIKGKTDSVSLQKFEKAQEILKQIESKIEALN